MIIAPSTIRAVAASPHIHEHSDAQQLVHTAAPLYRNGNITWSALIAACRLLYQGYDDYRPATKSDLLLEARNILRLGESTAA